MPLYTPDKIFARVTEIDIKRDLINCGYSGILLDIDNTVRSRATGAVPEDVAKWLRQVKEAGIGICLLSNNWHDSVYEFAKKVELPVVAKACKPLPHGYLLGKRKLRSKRTNIVAVGDQLLTDVLGAHILGIASYLVMPLAKQDLKHTKVMRGFERRLLGAHLQESNMEEKVV